MRIGLAVAGLAAAAVLSACSGSDSGGGSEGGSDGASASDFADGTADEITEAAKSAMGELTSVKVAGEITTDGETISLDLQSDSEGNCTGSIGVGGGSVELLGVDGSTWMKPDEAFWTSAAGASAEQILALVGDKWVVLPADDDSFKEFCNSDDLLEQIIKDENDDSTYTKTGTDTLDGQDVVLIDNEDPEDGTSTGYILVDDPHYLVKIEKTSGGDSGAVTFSEFDATVDVEAPAEDEQIDLDSLGS